MTKPQFLGAAVLLLASAATSHAAAVVILNSSFESPGGNPMTYASATDWAGSSFTEISTEVSLTGGTGVRYGGQLASTTMTQDLGVTFLANTTYTLTVALGNRVVGDISGSMRFGLTNGGTELGTFTLVAVPSAVTGGTFQDFTYTFTTGAVAPTGNVGISLEAPDPSQSQFGPGRGVFDNVRLDASPVPEPSAGLCALIGASLILAHRRRR